MADNNFLSQEEIDALLGNGDTVSADKEPQNDSYAENYDEQKVNLDLVMDFPLQISVRLGEVKKNLYELLQIGPGTVVELDRFVNDPVDIFINDKLIARGEVIVVDENFGIKITHIIAPLERIKKLV